MDESNATRGDAISRREQRPTNQQRTAVRHALQLLFDDLAPMAAPPRGAPRPRSAVQRHRSPHGCILQGEANAVSVSWFPAAETTLEHGELLVIVWRGVVSHPGSARRERVGAVALQEITPRPIEIMTTSWAWRGADGATYDWARVLATRCRAAARARDRRLRAARGESTTAAAGA